MAYGVFVMGGCVILLDISLRFRFEYSTVLCEWGRVAWRGVVCHRDGVCGSSSNDMDT